MKYLITGGCGFVGSNLAAEVLKKNEELYVLDNFYRNGSIKNYEWLNTLGDFTFLHADIRNNNDVELIIKKIKPEVIFHLCGQVAMTTSIENPRMDFEINTIGTYNLLEAVRKYSPDTIILYSSTNKVYGDFEHLTFEETETRYICNEYPDGFDESVPLDFHSPYGCSKGAADQYLLDYQRIFGLRTVVFRHSTMYGGRQFATYDQGWIGWFCQQAIEIEKGILKEPFTISGTGKQVRDVLHADDVVSLYFRTVENIDQAKGEAFNIGGGITNSLSLIELFNILEDELGIRMDFQKLPWRESDQKIFVANITKIKKRVSWEPKIDKIKGIKATIKWTKEQLSKHG
jgi:CDP-paratose 2-epimerase